MPVPTACLQKDSENILPIQESGQLHFVDREGDFTSNVLPGMDVLFVDGHTESMMIPHLHYKGRTVVFMADLLPSTGHIPLPYVMGYDTRPLLTLDEKAKFLQHAAANEFVLFLEHDSVNECCTLIETEKGILMGREEDRKKISMADIDYNEKIDGNPINTKK